MEIFSVLSRRMSAHDLDSIASWASESDRNRNLLFSFAFGDNGKIGSNALWCLTHLGKESADWLQSKQAFLTDALLVEKKISRKRMLLQLLRSQDYYKESLRGDFVDFCLSNINAESEPYAIRCFSLYIASKMCVHYPELMVELKECISMLPRASLSSGLCCAVRKVSKILEKP